MGKDFSTVVKNVVEKAQQAQKEQGQNVEGQGEKKPEKKQPKQTKGRNQGANQVEIIFRFGSEM